MVGPTGTGKSTYMNRYLLQGLPQDVWVPLNITLSARTTSNMVQEQVGIGFKDLHTTSQ
jgi:dynein heavy chain